MNFILIRSIGRLISSTNFRKESALIYHFLYTHIRWLYVSHIQGKITPELNSDLCSLCLWVVILIVKIDCSILGFLIPLGLTTYLLRNFRERYPALKVVWREVCKPDLTKNGYQNLVSSFWVDLNLTNSGYQNLVFAWSTLLESFSTKDYCQNWAHSAAIDIK